MEIENLTDLILFLAMEIIGFVLCELAFGLSKGRQMEGKRRGER